MTKIRVALIEDHDLTRLGIRTALQRNVDFEIVGEAANANDGLQILKTLQPDVAI
ncbi:MAG: DNA-binding response regulator, partial [Cyanobacteria bacterium J06636_27]